MKVKYTEDHITMFQINRDYTIVDIEIREKDTCHVDEIEDYITISIFGREFFFRIMNILNKKYTGSSHCKHKVFSLMLEYCHDKDNKDEV